MTKAVLYFDCFAGAAGDMLVGSLLDLGVDFGTLQAQLAKLPLADYNLTHTYLSKKGIRASKFSVDYVPQTKHRHLKDILALISAANYSTFVTQTCSKIFEHIARAEAKVHGTSIEKVHFHEVGAIDSIIDVCAFVLGLEMLGTPQVLFTPLPLGNGFVECEHGTIPVPAPATLELLLGWPTKSTPLEGELTTPTGAAILTGVGQCLPQMPELTVNAVGYGAGTRDMSIPNVVRAISGTVAASFAGLDEQALLLLETNIDDYQPETLPLVVEELLSLGALDVDYHPISMKKGRTGLKLSVLTTPSLATQLEIALFLQLPTLGIKRVPVSRVALERNNIDITTDYGIISVKLAYLHGRIVNIAPEFESIHQAARAYQVPARTLYDLTKLKTLELIDKGVIR